MPEPAPAPDPPREPDSEACREFQALHAGHLKGDLSDAQNRRFREHMRSCPACREHYRAGLDSAARMGRVLRESRLARQRSARRDDARRRVVAAGMGSGRSTRFRLQLVLIPALMIVLILGWRARGTTDPGLSIHVHEASEGGVQAAGVELALGADPRTLERGDCCFTEGPGLARIVGLELELVLGADTTLIIEDADEPRVRLLGGQLDVQGRCVVTTPLGIVESEDARSLLTLQGSRLEVEGLEGSVILVGAGGETRVGQGEHATTDAAGVAVVMRD
jgi:hypothetical protein